MTAIFIAGLIVGSIVGGSIALLIYALCVCSGSADQAAGRK